MYNHTACRMISGGNWWRANEIVVIRHHSRESETRQSSRVNSHELVSFHPRFERYQRKATSLADYPGREDDYRPSLHAHFDVVLEAVSAARAELLRLHRSGEIDDETLRELERDLDLEELSALSAKA